MTTLDIITKKVAVLAHSRNQLGTALGALNADIEKLRAAAMPLINRLMDEAAVAMTEVTTAIESNRGCFVQRKTVVAHGIKFGLQKGKGKIKVLNAKKTVQLIKKLMPHKADVLINTTEKLAKAAIGQLAVEDLKRIGCEVGDTGDQVLIKPADDNLDTLIKVLVGAKMEEAAEAEA